MEIKTLRATTQRNTSEMELAKLIAHVLENMKTFQTEAGYRATALYLHIADMEALGDENGTQIVLATHLPIFSADDCPRNGYILK